MNDAERFDIEEEASAIARKVIKETVRRIYKSIKDDDDSFDVIACTLAANEALYHSTFDVHIIIQPRKDGMHLKTSVKGRISKVQGDDDE